MRSITLAWAVAAAGLALPACSDDDDGITAGFGGAGGEADPTTTTGGAPATTSSSAGGGGSGGGLPWEPCPLYSGTSSGQAECVNMEAPLRYDEPDGSSIELAIKRIPAAEQPAR